MTDIALNPGDVVSLNYTGAAVTYAATATGTVIVKAWGGGGGTHGAFNSGNKAGGAGYVFLKIPVVNTDVLKFEVAQGGQAATSGVGGPGGYPDGGYGYRRSDANTAFGGGGGGGSTRVYKNGTLIAVAGGGGGSCNGASQHAGGAAGGSTGESSDAGGGSPTATGGSQIAGGISPTSNGTTNGASLTGGNGAIVSNTTGATQGGGGGGGGYFGGAGGYLASGSHVGTAGAGGSSFLNGSYTGTVLGGAGTVPGGLTDFARPAGKALGGISVNNGGPPGVNGGDGFVQFSFADLPTGSTAFAYSGAQRIYNIPSTGHIDAKLWGAGGGSAGSWTSGLPRTGGPGGYTSVTIPVTAGDYLIIDVGGGGVHPTSATGGAGGYPNGGYGSYNTTADPNNSGGGGGGSSNIFLNNVLQAAAGGGGGCQSTRTTASTVVAGGPGGGNTGSDSNGYTNSGTLAEGEGGTQSAGGLSFNAAGTEIGTRAGASLLGGHTPTVITTSETTPGGGGGGGYFGGGAGSGTAGSTTVVAPGGGGSSYVKSGLTGSTSFTAAPTNAAPNNSDTDYVTGIGVGGGTSAVGAGGNGRVVLNYVVGSAASTSGTLGTITMTTPAAGATGGWAGSGALATLTMTAPSAAVTVGAIGALPTVTMTAPNATAGVPAATSGALGTISLFAPSINAEASVTIGIPINDGVDLLVSTPTASAVGSGGASAGVGTVTMSGPAATVTGLAVTSGALGTITLTVPNVVGEPGVQATGAFGTVTLSPPTASATGQGAGTNDVGTISMSAPNGEAIGNGAVGQLATITVTAPEAQAIVPIPANTSGALGTITLTAANATAVGQIPGNAAGDLGTVTMTAPVGVGDAGTQATGAFGTVTMTAPNAGATGRASASGDLGSQVVMGRVQATVTINIAVGGLPLPNITMSPPAGVTKKAATVLAPFPTRILMTAPRAIIVIEGMVIVNGDVGTITVVAPEAAASGGCAIVPAGLPTIVMLTPEGGASGDNSTIPAHVFANLPVITTEALEGYVFVDDPAFAPLRFARTEVPGRAPASLEAGEIRLNEADGVLFTRDGAGAVASTPLGALAKGGLAPLGGDEGQVLAGDGSWITPAPVYAAPVRLSAPSATRIALSEGVLGAQTATPAKGKVFYRPFFVAKTLMLTDLGVEIDTPADAHAYVGVCTWIPGSGPVDLLVSGAISTGRAGLRTIGRDLTLTPGWYASILAVQGVGTPVFQVIQGSKTLNGAFSLVGDASAAFTGALTPLPAPTGLETEAWGFVNAKVAA